MRLLDGCFLLNLSTFDEEVEEIFGRLNKAIDYFNTLTENEKKRWICAYWLRFRLINNY
ncbi:MAG: hypothetical protein QXO75_05770 [Nitrososphaerota archaeon]